MELGYLTREGHLVVTDTLGRKTRIHAYRIDEAARTFEVLGSKRPMEPRGEVTVTVFLHRNGWSANHEVVLRRSRARLYETKTSHFLVGGTWKSIECLHERDDPLVHAPYLSALKPEPLKLSPDQPFVLIIEDASVKGQRHSGAAVELFGTERKEFMEVVLGKLRAVLEFAGEAQAASFASNFLPAQDTSALDISTAVDIVRSTDLVQPTPPTAGPKDATSIPERREVVDLRSKWPGLGWSRWAENPEGHAAAFAIMLKEVGAQTDTMRLDLEALDRFLRSLPADTLFGAFVMDAAAYVGQAFLATLGTRTRHRWTSVPTQPPQPAPVLYFDEVDVYVSPAVWICKVWAGKAPTTLHAYVAQWSFEVRNMLAFRHRVEFTSLGFSPTVVKGFKELQDRVRDDARAVRGNSHILGETHLETQVVPFGDFEIYYTTGEVIEPTGSRYLPVMAVPFTKHTQDWAGTLDGASPRSPLREDVAILRLQGNDLVPLGVQIVNYPEIGPEFAKIQGSLTLRTIAVADKGQILTPRLRRSRPEFKDFLAPIDGHETGVPLTPYANVLGLIQLVEETANPLTGLGLWHIRLDVSGFRCSVIVRKDRCEGIPSPGNHFTGRVWLAGRLEPERSPAASYIR